MSLIKKALEKDLQGFDDGAGKAAVNRMLLEKMIEKKRRQDEKLAWWFQVSLLLLLALFLFFVFRNMTGIADYQTILSLLVLASALLLTQVCYKLISLLGLRK